MNQAKNVKITWAKTKIIHISYEEDFNPRDNPDHQCIFNNLTNTLVHSSHAPVILNRSTKKRNVQCRN